MGVIDFWYRSGTHISQEEMLENIYEISSRGVLTSLKDQLRRNDL